MFFLVHVVLVQVQEHLRPSRGRNARSHDAVHVGEDLEELGLLLAAAAGGDAAVHGDAARLAVCGGLRAGGAGRREEGADEAGQVVVVGGGGGGEAQVRGDGGGSVALGVEVEVGDVAGDRQRAGGVEGRQLVAGMVVVVVPAIVVCLPIGHGEYIWASPDQLRAGRHRRKIRMCNGD